MDINIQMIPHKKQRYETVGDWYQELSGRLNIKVSDMGNWKYNFLVAFHEQIEAMLCFAASIREEDVTLFDLKFEEERKRGMHSFDAEPGNDPRAPYFKQHALATEMEIKMARELGVDWEAYEKAIQAL